MARITKTIKHPANAALGGATTLRRCLASVAVIVVGLVSHGPVRAIPIDLTRSEFTALGVGAVTVVEDFQGFSLALGTPDPLVLTNGTAANGLELFSGFAGDCPNPSNCLGVSRRGVVTTTFNAFRPGTTSWSADFATVLDTDFIQIVVLGLSGSANFVRFGSAFDFFGVHDSTGILSVAITNFGTSVGGGPIIRGAVGVDNVATIEPISTNAPPETDIAEPGALALLGIGLMGLYAIRRRRAG